MESLLNPIHTRHRKDLNPHGDLVLSKTGHLEVTKASLGRPEDALEILKSKPDIRELCRVLQWLDPTTNQHDDFNIRVPSPKSSQIIYALVNDVLYDYWVTLSDSEDLLQLQAKNLFIRCLSSVAGIGAIVSRLRHSISQLRDRPVQSDYSSADRTQAVDTLLDALEAIFGSDGFIASIWNDIDTYISQATQKSLQWKEFISLVASGRIISVASEANAIVNDMKSSVSAGSWVGDGPQYAAWLGRNIQHMIRSLVDEDLEGLKVLSQLFKKALTLGFAGLLRIQRFETAPTDRLEYR